jgi:hypothetical protein
MPTQEVKKKTPSLDVGVVTESLPNSLRARGKSTANGAKPPTNLSSTDVANLSSALDSMTAGDTPEYTWCGVKRFAYQLPEELRKKLLSVIDDTSYTAPQIFNVVKPFADQINVHITENIIYKHRLRLKSAGCSCVKIAGQL